MHAGTQRGGDLGAEALRRARCAADAGSRSTRRGRCARRTLGPLHLTGELDPELLRHVQALKLSEEEALAAFGTLDATEIARRTGVAGGARHARARRALTSPPTARSAPSAPTSVAGVDPTGAGDSFLALYADGRAEGLSPLAAADAACSGVSAVLAARVAAISGSSGRERPFSQS